MIKKISAAILLLAVLVCFASCNFDNENSKEENIVSAAAKTTAVHNHFKDRIPEYSFENEPVEKYEDGFSYILSVKCSQREYKNYLKKLKKTGFEQNPIEADTYYSASDEEGYFVEVTYVGEMLTVLIKGA